MSKQTCAERMRIALDRANMSQTDLSKKTKIPKSAISQYIKGSFEPKQDRVYLISKALHVSEAWLMGFDVPIEKIEADNKTTDEELEKDIVILNRNARKMTPDNRKKLIEMAKLMFGEDFDG